MPAAARASSGRRSPASALSVCAVVMFVRRLLAADVLLARLQREHEAAAAVDVGRLARDPARASGAGTPRAAAKKPNDGPPKSSRLPSGWPSPTAMSTPKSPGGRRIPSVIGSHWHDDERAGLLRGGRRAPRGPRRRRGSSAAAGTRRRRRRRRASRAARRRRSRRRRAGSPRPRAPAGAGRRSALARVRVQPARDQEAAAAVELAGEPAGGGDRARAPRRASRWRPAARSARRSPSGTRTSPAACPARPPAGTACTASGTPTARAASRSARARSGRTSRRRGR